MQGQNLKFSRPSDFPGCPAPCRGCLYRTFSYAESIADKENYFERVTGRRVPVEAAPLASRLGYRDRVLFHVRRSARGFEFGLLGRRVGKDRELISTEACPVQTDRVTELIGRIRYALALHLEAFEHLRFVQITRDAIVFVMKERPREDLRQILGLIFGKGEWSVRSVFINFNPAAGRRVFNAKGFVTVLDEGGRRDFSQQIDSMHRALIQRARDFLEVKEADLVLDLYSGSGTTAAIWSRAGARVQCVEQASASLAELRALGGQVEVFSGAVEDRLPQLRTEGKVFANPPRAGLGEATARWMDGGAFQKIAYQSCSVGTLQVDLRRLSRYQVVELIPYDFFPFTQHFEVLALLQRI